MQVTKQFKPTKLTLLTIMLCSMLMLMGGAAVAPALPLIEQVFPGQDTLVSMFITIPSLAVALVGFAMGALADRLGKVKVLATSLVVFTAAGAVGFLMEGGSDTQLYILLAFRFVVGIGIAGISSAVTALIAEYYTGMDRIKALSYQSAAMGVGVLILEYTGGLLAEFSWREPFLVYLIGVPILLMVLLTMKEPRRDVHDPAERIVPERTANKRLLMICYVTIFVAMTMAFLLPTKMPTYLQTELAVSTSVTGLFLGVHGVTNACFSLMYRRFVQRLAPFRIIAIGFLLLKVRHAFLIAAITAFLDFLPAFGVGFVLWPWIALALLQGKFVFALLLAVVYLATQVVRQVLQPKIMGETMGLPPLWTLFFLFVGFKFYGLLGMIFSVPVGMFFLSVYRYGLFDGMIGATKELCRDIGRILQEKEPENEKKS